LQAEVGKEKATSLRLGAFHLDYGALRITAHRAVILSGQWQWVVECNKMNVQGYKVQGSMQGQQQDAVLCKSLDL
jgi:hypothetical protein